MSSIVSSSTTFEQTLLWYTFRQNNSGGFVHVNDHEAHYVSVQAVSEQEAIRTFEPHADNSDSCPCCGTRWDLDDPEPGNVPTYYSSPLYEVLNGPFNLDENTQARLYRYDGSIFKLTKGGIRDNPKLFEEIQADR